MKPFLGVIAFVLITVHSLHAQSAPANIPDCAVTESIDLDRDGLSDACELALARAFSPVLVVRSDGCNWSADNARLAGAYYFAVQPVDSLVRIAYLPAYFRDCGWSGIKCWLPWLDCSPHNGDSEFIVVETRRDAATSHWSASRVFLSAHCFGRSSASCRWYNASELGGFEWSGSSPVIWVAEGRNANYPSRQRCDEGHHSIDTCDHNDTRYPYPIDPARNLGSRSFPMAVDGCVTGAELRTAGVDAKSVECMWRANTLFRGWQSEGRGVTGYWRYLSEIAQF